ncbi:solute carrier family 2, facilitated glucose transporter member 8-like [Haemaphysalis longicornis]
MEARTTPEGVEGIGKLHFEVSPAPVTPSPANNAAMTMLRLWRPRVKGGSPVNDVEGPPAEGQHVHAMLVASLGSCVAGTTLGYASAAMPSIEKEPWYNLAKTAPGNHFPADIVLLAAAFGALCSGLLLHLVGHRRTFIVCVLGLLGAWIGIIFSNTVWMFMLNRAASGVWLGIMTNCASLYVTDVAPPEKRALYGSLTEAV